MKNYVGNRDTLLEEANINKYVINAVMNGGKTDYNNIKTKPEWLMSFKNEVMSIHNETCELYPDDYQKYKETRLQSTNKKKHTNHKASFMNSLLCELENKILMTMYRFFGSPKEAVLCFDGIMLQIGEYDLQGCC